MEPKIKKLEESKTNVNEAKKSMLSYIIDYILPLIYKTLSNRDSKRC